MQILVISSIYPGEGTPKSFTSVVHYFVREWVKFGYDVRVIHTCTFFPRFYYKAPNWIRRLLQNKLGIALPETRLDKEVEYEFEGVKVFRIPMKKFFPMSNYSDKVLRRACEKVKSYISINEFHPQHIISHWLNPQLEIVSFLKHITGATTTLVLHGASKEMGRPFKNWDNLVKDVDIWGYRSNKTKDILESVIGIPKFSFRCISGIPEYYTQCVPNRDGSFHHRFVQVGLLIERKYPDKTMDALSSVYEDKNYMLSIIGDGSMRGELEAKVKNNGTENRVVLHGRLSRQEIIPILDSSDVFILISKNEVFGLAYIEAMARGCIVIASRGEGMEGIIRNGQNGFLCEAGNTDELEIIIKQIMNLSNKERKRISEDAIATSRLLTDVAVAKGYIDTVVRFGDTIKKDSINRL